jgi:penicillin-binding protein 2
MPGDWRGPRMPGQLPLRMAILGGVGIVAFAIIFLRLWYLQVLSGDNYLAQAQNNQVRDFTVQAPRGKVVDRHGNVLVENRTALALQLKPLEIPTNKTQRAALFGRLQELSGLRPKQIRHAIRDEQKQCSACPVTLRRDVPFDTVYYLRENQDRFPGVSVERVFVRRYPQGQLAAHVLGSVGEVSSEDLASPEFEGLQPGDIVGQAGVESAYDNVLRGVDGETRVQVDAAGQPTGGTLSERDPEPGNNLVLSIDDRVQEAGEAGIASLGLPGGFVAMNIHTGQLYGLGSSPSYSPSVFAKPRLPESTYRALTDPDLGNQLLDRATAGLYPTGSIFKPITALAALDSGALGLNETYNDTGEYHLEGLPEPLHNAGDAINGVIDLREALKVSSDVFFYHLGFVMDRHHDHGEGGPLQEWASKLGIGQATGLDIGGEQAGLLPTPAWRNALYRKSQEPQSPGGKEVVPDDFYKYGGQDRPWSAGDNVNLAVGQGDLQADPLQMAVAYGAIANGGDLVTPHVGLRVDDPEGRTIQEIAPPARSDVDIDPAAQRTILAGLHDAAMSPGGTSYPVFCNYPVQMAGKTGTAERGAYQADQSWYMALAPYDNPKYVVAVTVERGGFGADSAAPVAKGILDQLLHVDPNKDGGDCDANGLVE